MICCRSPAARGYSEDGSSECLYCSFPGWSVFLAGPSQPRIFTNGGSTPVGKYPGSRRSYCKAPGLRPGRPRQKRARLRGRKVNAAVGGREGSLGRVGPMDKHRGPRRSPAAFPSARRQTNLPRIDWMYPPSRDKPQGPGAEPLRKIRSEEPSSDKSPSVSRETNNPSLDREGL